MTETVRAVLVRLRGMKVSMFCQRYNIGKTKAYEEIKAGRLKARKCGKSTTITEDDAEDWLRNLPVLGAAEKPDGKRRKSAPHRREDVS